MTDWAPVLELVERRSGLDTGGHQRPRVVALAEHAAARAGRADGRALAAHLEAEPGAFAELMDAVLVNESYFFRDPAQMALLRKAVLPDLAAGPGGIAVWSAGCGAGEEAYTLAMLGVEAGLGPRLRVLGTDLSTAALERAEAGVYGPWSLRGVDERARRRWFAETPAGHLVRPGVRDVVRFRLANLLDGPPDRFDLVVCRNVLMYFTPAALTRATSVLHAALRPGGWLVTGASDPPLTHDELVRVRTAHGLAYRREPVPTRATPPLPAPSAAPAPSRPPTVGEDRPAPASAVASPAPPAAARPAPPGALARARALADSGRSAAALDVLAAAVADDPWDARLHCLAAVLHLGLDDVDAAARAARAALYLDREQAVAHLVLGHVARARGDAPASARSYQRAARALARGEARDG